VRVFFGFDAWRTFGNSVIELLELKAEVLEAKEPETEEPADVVLTILAGAAFFLMVTFVFFAMIFFPGLFFTFIFLFFVSI